MELPKRKPTRLRDFDYSKNGYYFITICSHNKRKIFSNIVGEGFPLPQLTPQGKIANEYILKIDKKYPHIKPEKYVIMPNHIHIIISVNNNGRGNPSPTISNMVGWLKYNITKQINLIIGNVGNKIFQRSFHDHIIRGDRDFLEIWNYIDSNPAKWEQDKFYME